MFINDVNKKEEIRNIAIQHLRKHGIKYRPKKPRPTVQGQRHGKKFFKVPLTSLATETVTLMNGQQLIIPKRIHEICSFILSKVQTEGIFRKEGSKSRQNEIKLSLDRGVPLGNDHHVIDVAVVLKSFLRELPEPLIAPAFNDLFLMCSLDKRPKTEILNCLLLSCLLLPSENLNVLSYLMQFFSEVASFSLCNKMNVGNLAILVGPNIFPMDDKLAPKSSLTITRICEITKLLIENSKSIGYIPEYIIEQIGQLSEAEDKRKKHKRRSGSLTRMFNGLKKIVTSKNEEDPQVPPDLLLTPTIHASMKKKKVDTGLSLKKKKEVLTKLPENVLLSTPFRTPVSGHPDGKKPPPEDDIDQQKDKKMSWYMRSKSMKSLKSDESISSSRRNSLEAKTMLERRWSQVSNAANFRKKKRTKKEPEPDYVRVSKVEYEEFKSRVSEIERRISMELDNVQSVDNVQTVYEKTLEENNLSPTTDQLAKRLSRDLRIRRSAEQKIIRSPSARKIGTLRRRSTERERKTAQLVRTATWHNAPLLPRVSMRRKRRMSREETLIISQMNLEPEVTPPPSISKSTSLERSASLNSNQQNRIRKISSSPNLESTRIHDCSPFMSCNNSVTSNEHWVSAEGFFSAIKTPNADGSVRASIAKLRAQNVGMVKAKARLFDTLKDSDTSTSSVTSAQSSKGNKDVKTTQRGKTLRSGEARKTKGIVSPRRRQQMTRQKLHTIAKQYVGSPGENMQTKEVCTPRRQLQVANSPRRTPRQTAPPIKVPLTVKTPKRLCRTPAVDRKTPFRVIATPM